MPAAAETGHSVTLRQQAAAQGMAKKSTATSNKYLHCACLIRNFFAAHTANFSRLILAL
jgi:hypothetical protein